MRFRRLRSSTAIVGAAVVVAMLLGGMPVRADVDLGIAPVQQATPVWCWLAVGEMLFRKLGVPAVNPHYQCGVIGAISIATNQDDCARDCRRCAFPAGTASTVLGMLVDYPRRAALLSGRSAPRVFATHADALTPPELRRELEAGRPVLAGINPGLLGGGAAPDGFAASAHVALIVGYAERDGKLWLLVNDPFPFGPPSWPDPYLAAGATLVQPGRYAVPYATFTGGLGWVESFLVRVEGQHQPAPLQCVASTPLMQTRCPAPRGTRPGTPCTCGAASGVVVDGA
jgi:hypothetical protein